MVDSIANNNINTDIQAGGLSQSQLIERINSEATYTQQAGKSPFGDKTDISDQARALAAREQEASHYAALLNREEEPFDSQKVAYFKGLLDSGRINDYLRGLNNNDLADSLLNSPAATLIQ